VPFTTQPTLGVGVPLTVSVTLAVPPTGTVTLVGEAESSGACCDEGNLEATVMPAQPPTHDSNKKTQIATRQASICCCRPPPTSLPREHIYATVRSPNSASNWTKEQIRC